METSWIKTWKQNPTTITNGHKTVKMALTKWNVSSVPRYAAHVIRKKITSGKRDHGCGGFQINYKVGKSINCDREGHAYLPYRRSLTPHSLTPLSPYSSTYSTIYFHALIYSILSPLTGSTLSPLTHSTFSPTYLLINSLTPLFNFTLTPISHSTLSLSPFTDTALSLFTHSILFSLHP